MASYAGDRIIHDADSHIMEIGSDWSEQVDDSLLRDIDPQLPPRLRSAVMNQRSAGFEKMIARHDDPAYREKLAHNVMLQKNHDAAGSFRRADRPWTLDLLGFRSQLVFGSIHLERVHSIEHADDPSLAYRFAEAHNRSMLEFCSVDTRLLPVGYLPLTDLDRAASFAASAIEAGVSALMIDSHPSRWHSPSHIGLETTWATLSEAGIPLVLHVQSAQDGIDPVYQINGRPKIPDFHGGDTNFNSVTYMPVANGAMQVVATLILDGVLERFPDLKVGMIELGAHWLPGWLRSMDSAATAFARNEERLQQLSLLPSEYVQRQVRVTPYPHEDAGWCIRESAPEICMFGSDYPHIEGGRKPLQRFDQSLSSSRVAEQEGFYWRNFEDLMGPSLPEPLRASA